MNDETKQVVQRVEHNVYVSLKEHIEVIMREQQRAIEHQVKSGDDAMERHIDEQVSQLRGLIRSQSELINQAHSSAQSAIDKAEKATERRLALLNEFRAQQADESKKYLTFSLYDGKHTAIADRISRVESQISKIFGGLIVIGAIGITNLVKIWFIGH